MTKLGTRAITLLRSCDRKGDWLPGIWLFIERETGGRYLRLTDLVIADLDGDFDAHRTAILQRIVTALEVGDVELLVEQETITKGNT